MVRSCFHKLPNLVVTLEAIDEAWSDHDMFPFKVNLREISIQRELIITGGTLMLDLDLEKIIGSDLSGLNSKWFCSAQEVTRDKSEFRRVS